MAGLLLLLVCNGFAQDSPIVYERDIAPVFRTYCAGCHNDADREGELSVERYATLRQGGVDEGDPILPGRPDDSFIIRSLEGRSTPRMPPRDEPRVPDADIASLRKWIAVGAPGPKVDQSILETIAVPDIAPDPNLRPPVTALAASPNGQRFAVGSYARVEVRQSLSGPALVAITDLPGKVNAVHFSPDGERLIIATGITGLRGVARIHDAREGRLLREFAGHRDALLDAELSPGGAVLATAGYDHAIRLWRVENGELMHTIEVHNGAVFDLAFDPSGQVLASASADQTVKLWRVADAERLDTLNQPQGELHAVAFTPDGRHILAAGADRRIYLWEFVSRKEPRLNPVVDSRFAHENAITAFALAADGNHLLTASADRTVKLWSVPDLVELHAYGTQSDVVAAVISMPRGDQFILGRMDGTVDSMSVVSERKPEPPSLASSTDSPPAVTTESAAFTESEPNDDPAHAQAVPWPIAIQGRIQSSGDHDVFRFQARAGQPMTLAIEAARSGSSLDSRIEVLHADGQPVEQVVLQAVRDSWFTFRGKDSDTSDDFRLQNWREMELNEYLYANGEVVRLWLYPRGPDSGFKVYPGAGKRHTAFATTALTHALNEPCYIVEPHPSGSEPVPNGLPVYRLPYENDDDPTRQWGRDSLLLFDAPRDGEYLARVTDVRGFGGETNFHYTLSIRERRPDFTVAVGGKNPKISPGSGREITFTATRLEGFDGPIRIDMTNLPDGFTASTPVEIEAEQHSAIAVLYAGPDAGAPAPKDERTIQIAASAEIRGRAVRRELGALGDVELAAPPKLTVAILPGSDAEHVKETTGQPLEFFIRPGETITALVRAERHDFDGRIELGNDDSGRNLPHGVFVDNIGLNGLLIVEGQTEREFFITASPVTQPGTTRRFHLRATADGGQASPYAILHVLPPQPEGRTQAALAR